MEYFLIFIFIAAHLFAYIDNEDYYYRDAHVEYGFYTFAGFLLLLKIHFGFSDKIVLNILLIGAIILFYFIFIKKIHDPQEGNIKAKQVNFWDVKHKDILTYTKDKIIQKKGRREYEPDKLDSLRNDYFIDLDVNGFKKIHTNFLLLHLKDYNHFSIHEGEVEHFFKDTQYKLYKMVFKKIKWFISESEDDIDLNEKLYDNNHCIEFFLMDLWEKYAHNFSMGIGTLQSFIYNEEDGLKDENLEIFLYALDASANSVIHRKGFPLYFYYYHFKEAKKRGQKYGY